ncbi:MAG TPA: helix-turn-helix transcriptional regulator [Gemmatimonadaceae bacterium]
MTTSTRRAMPRTVREIQRRIRRLRDLHSLTRRAFAQRVGVHARRITDWEEHSLPSAAHLVLICRAFDVDLNWLIGLTGVSDVPQFRGAVEVSGTNKGAE